MCVMFTCLESRAVLIEVLHSMTTDSFIQAVFSDNGPNFVGTEQELINAFNEMDRTKIQGFLQNNIQIGSNGRETHQQQATWVVYGSTNFVQPGQGFIQALTDLRLLEVKTQS